MTPPFVPPLHRPPRALRCALTAGLLAACAHPGTGDLTAITLGATPRLVSFGAPVQGSGEWRQVCLAGDPSGLATLLPGGGTSLRAVLVSAEGPRDTLRAPVLDRRGDDMVCLAERAPRAAAPLTWLGVELTASAPVTVREVRWWVGPPVSP